jgi:Protein of unknown function (DUF4239)
MLYWIYDIHPLAAVGIFAALFVTVGLAAIMLSRSFVQSRVHQQPELNELVGDFLQYFGVIYGLLLGLLAVATYQNHSDVEKTVSNEASSLAALYRDVSAYPEPKRSELEAGLRDYTRYVIEEAWPLQRKGIIPAGAVKKVPHSTQTLSVLNLKRNLKKRYMKRPLGSSIPSSNTGGHASTASPLAFHP